MKNRLHQVALPVRDLEVAERFYEEIIGLTPIKRFDPPGLAFFDLAGTRLLLERMAEPTIGHSVLYLETPDISAEHARLLRAGVDFLGEPRLIHLDAAGAFGAPGTEEWMAFFHDPDGNALALVQRRIPTS